MRDLSQKEKQEVAEAVVSLSDSMSDIAKSLCKLNETMTNIDKRLTNIEIAAEEVRVYTAQKHSNLTRTARPIH